MKDLQESVPIHPDILYAKMLVRAKKSLSLELTK